MLICLHGFRVAAAGILFATAVAATPPIGEYETTSAARQAPEPYARGAMSSEFNQSEPSIQTSSVFDVEAPAATGSPRRGMANRAINKVAREIQKMHRRSIDNPFDYYLQAFRKAQDKFERAEESAGSLGIEKSDFREGIIVTTAGTAAILGTLFLVKPVGMTDYLMSTMFRVGYDVSQLDDPKMYVTYADRFNLGVSRNGLGGSFRDDSGRIYTAELNIFKLRGTVKLNF